MNDYFFVQWFVAIKTGHYFARYRLGSFSWSLLDYKIILKRHQSIGHESSLVDNFLMRDLWFLWNPFWALEVWRVLLPKLRTGILWVINTWPYERPLSTGSPGMSHPKILPGFLPPLPTDVALGLGDPLLSRSKSLFCFFLSDLHCWKQFTSQVSLPLSLPCDFIAQVLGLMRALNFFLFYSFLPALCL